MKKALFATTALVLSAGVAAADVTISGYGRSGVLYQEDGVGGPGSSTNDTIIQSRLRMNIDASTSTDQGVDFGGRIRIQWDQGDDETTVAPGYVYVTASGLKVELGNSNTAYDSAALMYNSEIGVYSRSFGNSRGDFFAYNTDGYPTFANVVDGTIQRRSDYMGVMVSYAIAGVNLRFSQIDPDQVSSIDTDGDDEKEYSISADYVWNDMLTLSAAAVQNGAGIEDNDQYFLGAEYAFNDRTDIGILFFDNGDVTPDSDLADLGNTVTLYGSYEVAPLTTINGYVANNDADGNETDNAFGIGGEYDLGGAMLAGSIQRGYDERITADMGFRFDF
ncbi:porin (plasmid) [Paracoccus sp. TK19116]|uniref:Porin n=1 Tax=Paracoccus albicereus TaxID=2922394 RepID=A0ABT1MRD5_9RHOB|nr:porin [Paracoccus albicereus]MCQ0969451.1 porin [Paracoccus albicereus]